MMKTTYNRKEMNMRTKNLYFALFIFIIAFASINLLSAEKNQTELQVQALKCINDGNSLINNMISDGFSVLRINDTIKQAVSLYDAQITLMEKKTKYDFSLSIETCESAKNVSVIAYEVRDEINALLKFYNDSYSSGINFSSIDLMIKNIQEDFQNEKYEEARENIDPVYSEIVNLKASNTALNLFYQTTTRTILGFFIQNWIIILSVLIVLTVLFFIFKRAITRFLIKRKISGLEVRKTTLKDLIMKTQKEYFEKGGMSEGSYTIRTKKFSELIRDIDRQIPLLKEKLLKVSRREQDSKNKKGNSK